MKRTKEEALITRKNLLSAALKVFSKKGYSATRLEDIALKAGVTRGAIYHHFGGKEELFKELVTERSIGVNQLAEQILSEGGSPATMLRRLLVRLFEYSEEDEDYRAMLEIATDKVEYTAELEEVARQNIRSRLALIRVLANLIRKGIEAGDFRADLSAKDAAIAVAGFLNGVGLLWVQDPDSFSIRRRSEALVDVMMGGMLA
jgi:TetR/AcrR family acrAB operon transcriptional repressor